MSKLKKFKKGDIVKLKSGGPNMTIQACHENMNTGELSSYKCQWFAGKKLEVGNFSIESVEAPPEETK